MGRKEQYQKTGGRGRRLPEDRRDQVRRLFRHGVGTASLSADRTFEGILSGQQLVREEPIVAPVIPDEPLSTDPLGTVNLRMYTPNERRQITSLVSHYVGTANLNILAELSRSGLRRHEAERKATYLDKHSEVSEKDYDERRKEQLDQMRERTKRRINYHVYRTIQQSLGLESLTQAAKVFEDQRKIANKAVIDHAAIVYPEEERSGLRNEVNLLKRPADILEKALQAGTDHELQFELRRQFINIVIGLHEAKGRSRIADEKLAQIQNLLNDKFYAGKTGKNQPINIYGLFDNETNGLIDEPLFAPPTDTAPEGAHYKTLLLSTRQTKSGVFVLTRVDEKEQSAATRKAVRKAQERKIKGEGDTISIEEDVQDTYRMRLVVLGDQVTTDHIAAEIFELLSDHGNNSYFYDRDVVGDLILDDKGHPTGIPTGGGEVQFGNRGGAGQSYDVNYTKIAPKFQNVRNPIKIVIQSLASYITEKLEVGKYDIVTGEYVGPAHESYGEKREQYVSPSFFPESVYPQLRRRGPRDPKIPRPRAAEIVNKLRTTRIFEEV